MANVMVIDDDQEVTEFLTVALQDAGHSVAVMNTVNGALERLVADRPDLLVLDVMFPGNASGGMELAVLIRQKTELKGLYGQSVSKLAGMEPGVGYFVSVVSSE